MNSHAANKCNVSKYSPVGGIVANMYRTKVQYSEWPYDQYALYKSTV